MILKSSIPVLFALLCVAASGQNINPFGPVPQLRICPAVSASDQVLDVAPSGSTWVCKTLTFTSLGGTASKAQLPATTVFTDQANTFGAFLQTFKSGSDFKLSDPADTTKLAHFDLSNITTLTERTINIPDANSTTAQAAGAVSHQFVTAMSAQGVFSQAQPTLADVNGGTAPVSQTYNYNNNPIQSVVLDGAGSGNSVTLVDEQGPTGTLTGNSTDQTIYTKTISANTIAASKGIHIRAHFNRGAATNSMTVKLFFGATACISDSGAVAGTEWLEFWIFNNSGVQNAQHGYGDRLINGITPFGQTCSPSENTANAVTVKATFNVANTDTIQGTGWLVDLIQ